MKLSPESASAIVARTLPKYAETLAEEIEKETDGEVSEVQFDKLADALLGAIEDALSGIEVGDGQS